MEFSAKKWLHLLMFNDHESTLKIIGIQTFKLNDSSADVIQTCLVTINNSMSKKNGHRFEVSEAGDHSYTDCSSRMDVMTSSQHRYIDDLINDSLVNGIVPVNHVTTDYQSVNNTGLFIEQISLEGGKRTADDSDDGVARKRLRTVDVIMNDSNNSCVVSFNGMKKVNSATQNVKDSSLTDVVNKTVSLTNVVSDSSEPTAMADITTTNKSNRRASVSATSSATSEQQATLLKATDDKDQVEIFCCTSNPEPVVSTTTSDPCRTDDSSQSSTSSTSVKKRFKRDITGQLENGCIIPDDEFGLLRHRAVEMNYTTEDGNEELITVIDITSSLLDETSQASVTSVGEISVTEEVQSNVSPRHSDDVLCIKQENPGSTVVADDMSDVSLTSIQKVTGKHKDLQPGVSSNKPTRVPSMTQEKCSSTKKADEVFDSSVTSIYEDKQADTRDPKHGTSSKKLTSVKQEKHSSTSNTVKKKKKVSGKTTSRVKREIKDNSDDDDWSVPRKKKRKHVNEMKKTKRQRKKDIEQDDESDDARQKVRQLNKKYKSQKKPEQISAAPCVRVVGSVEHPKDCFVLNMPADDENQDQYRRKQLRQEYHASGFVAPSVKLTDKPVWKCAFCGRGSSYKGMGDLFGPYFITPIQPPLPSATSSGKKTTPKKRGKKSQGPSTSAQFESVETKQEEVWTHMECAVWTSGIYVAGGRLQGLEEAIHSAADSVCRRCRIAGATLGCLRKSCKHIYHFLCARDSGCEMNEERLSVICTRHKGKVL